MNFQIKLRGKWGGVLGLKFSRSSGWCIFSDIWCGIVIGFMGKFETGCVKKKQGYHFYGTFGPGAGMYEPKNEDDGKFRIY